MKNFPDAFGESATPITNNFKSYMADFDDFSEFPFDKPLKSICTFEKRMSEDFEEFKIDASSNQQTNDDEVPDQFVASSNNSDDIEFNFEEVLLP